MVTLKFKTLYEDQVIQILLDSASSLLQLAFLQTPDTDHFRNGYRLAIDIALSKDVTFWLTDARQIKAMLPENQIWLKQRMAPALTSQVRKFAIVMAPECFVMTSPNQVYEKPERENETQAAGLIKVHFDIEAAYDWIFDGAYAL